MKKFLFVAVVAVAIFAIGSVAFAQTIKSSVSSMSTLSSSQVSSSAIAGLKADSLGLGASSPDVAAYQANLKKLGYYSGSASGVLDVATQSAIQAFQRSNGLTPDGILGDYSKAKLSQLASAPAASVSAAVAPTVTPAIHAPLGSTITPVPGPAMDSWTRDCILNNTPKVQVLTPNGGETYTVGQPITITWRSCNVTGTVNASIFYYPNGLGQQAFGYPRFNLANSGQTTFIVPSLTQWGTIPAGTTLNYGTNFKIYLASSAPQSGGMYASDFSDNVFTINATGSQASSLVISRDANDLPDHTVQGSTTINTTNVQLAVIDATAQGGSVTLRSLPVGLTLATTNIPSAGVNTLRLYDSNGNQLDAETVPTGSGTEIITFRNFNLLIPAGSTKVFTVKGDLNPIGSVNFPSGSYVHITTSTASNATIQATDANGNLLSGSSIAGSSTGSNVYVNTGSVQTCNSILNVSSWGTPTAVASVAGGGSTHNVGTFTIPFVVTSTGCPQYIPATALQLNNTSARNHVQFTINTGNGFVSTGATGVVTSTTVVSGDSNGNFFIAPGSTRNFMLTASFVPSAVNQYRAALYDIPFSTINASQFTGNYATGYASSLVPGTNGYMTPFVALQ
ncbi:MAG: hypothetical protein JWM20_411 [Patescibacteria group bacterium]|nr:hypothetical protein [Patescibacteria group bacterium]